MKTTLIIGASTNPDRYSYKAAHLLKKYDHAIVNYGIRAGDLAGEQINTTKEIPQQKIDTVTMYVSVANQADWYDFILALKPNRVIFNPGTENNDFYTLLQKHNINYEEACTLVLLNSNQY
jgi:uncharacterized protein